MRFYLVLTFLIALVSSLAAFGPTLSALLMAFLAGGISALVFLAITYFDK